MSQGPTISVKGVGSVSIPADLTVLSFDMSARNFEYVLSVEELNKHVADLRKKLRTAGVNPKELKTTSFSVDADYRYEKDKEVFFGWVAHHRMRLELPVDREKLNRALEAVTTSTAQAKLRVRFEVRDKAAAREAVLADATRTARRNAEAIASAANCRLGKVMSIEYGWSEIRFGSVDYNMEARGDVLASRALAPDIEPEDVEATDSVTMVFELVEK